MLPKELIRLVIGKAIFSPTQKNAQHAMHAALVCVTTFSGAWGRRSHKEAGMFQHQCGVPRFAQFRLVHSRANKGGTPVDPICQHHRSPCSPCRFPDGCRRTTGPRVNLKGLELTARTIYTGDITVVPNEKFRGRKNYSRRSTNDEEAASRQMPISLGCLGKSLLLSPPRNSQRGGAWSLLGTFTCWTWRTYAT